MSEQSTFKVQVLEEGLSRQKQLILDFEESIAELRSSAKIGNVGNLDLSEAGLNDEMQDRIDQLSAQLNFARDEMKVLKTIDADASTSKVYFGSIVETNRLTVFIAVSLEKLIVGDKIVFGISRDAPLYKVMEGKQAGDSFEFNKNRFEIKSVY